MFPSCPARLGLPDDIDSLDRLWPRRGQGSGAFARRIAPVVRRDDDHRRIAELVGGDIDDTGARLNPGMAFPSTDCTKSERSGRRFPFVGRRDARPQDADDALFGEQADNEQAATDTGVA